MGSASTSHEVKATSDQGTTEVFRGNQAKPPRIWGIVAEASRVVIYALDLPGRPMWMVFSVPSNAQTIYGRGTFWNFKSVFALNGELLFGSTSNSAAAETMLRVNFAKDTIDLYGTINVGGRVLANIAQRNNTGVAIQTGTTGNLVGFVGNAVAMCLMPDAPCDPVTGLRVPTIAVWTAAGRSIIQNNGTVVSSADVSNCASGWITPYALFSIRAASANVDYALKPGTLGASFAVTLMAPGSAPDFTRTGTSGGKLVMAGRATIAHAATNVAAFEGMRFNESNPAASLGWRIADTYNTGLWCGDIRRCYLSDTAVGVLGGNFLAAADGNFSADTGYWQKDPGVSISGGVLNFAGVAAGNALFRTGGFPVAGRAYTVTFTVSSFTSGGVRPAVGGTFGTTRTAAGTYTETIVATSNAGGTGLYSTAAGSTLQCSNLSFVEAVSDRSYKAKILQAFGTLTRSQVGVGSQLVAYSGFGAGNYLQEPAYSADLDFGMGAWEMRPWCSIPAYTFSTFSPYNSLPGANFGVAANLPQSMNTAQWAKGTGWTCPAANSFQADGSAGAAQSDLAAASGTITSAPAAGTVRRWTLTITALALNGGSLTIYPSNGSPINITQTGTYTLYGTAPTSVIRVVGGTGPTVSGTLQVDDLANAPVANRAYSSGPYWDLSVNPLGYLVGTAYDGTTTRTVVSPASYAGAGWIMPRLSYDTSGTLSLKVNGNTVAQTTGAPLLTLNNASALLSVGTNYAQTSFFPGSIALVRIGATVATDDQSAFMYAQEAEMFRDGAQVCLPDSGALVDLAYDRMQDKWKTVSAANEASFTGLVQTGFSPVPAGSFTKASHESGCKLLARSTTNPGVDVTIPPWALREELYRRAEDAARVARIEEPFDWTGQFTATTTNGSTALTNVASLVYPANTTIVGATISGTGIPAGTTIVAISGTTIYMSSAATASGSGVAVSMLDFILPPNWETKKTFAAGSRKREGASFDWTRKFDGFRERASYAAAPGNVNVTIDGRRMLA
jgi:hypothetical protein